MSAADRAASSRRCATRGVNVLGIDAAPSAIACAHACGRRVVQRSVFDPIPGEGSWATVLLFDGNIGIGGAPTVLLHRVRELMNEDGCVVVELEPPGAGLELGVVEFEVATGMIGWFPWCWVGVEEIAHLANGAGLRVDETRAVDGRWFAWLRRCGTRRGGAFHRLTRLGATMTIIAMLHVCQNGRRAARDGLRPMI